MISICIATFKREKHHDCLLHLLVGEIERPEPIEIVVCDNDSARSAEDIVNAASKDADISIRYYCEPEQNISLARNKTVHEAKGQWIAFIDDDEPPHKNWLSELYKAIKTFNADGAFGPVEPKFPQRSGFIADINVVLFSTPNTSGYKIKNAQYGSLWQCIG